jgi:RNA polymerase sigma-70 factor (ECF subfamily)
MVFRRCIDILKNEDDARDMVQDVFVNLVQHKSRMHGQFLSSLLYTMATNTCLNRLKSGYRREAGVNNIEELAPAKTDAEFEKVELKMILDNIFKEECSSTRDMCFMYWRDNMTLQEIAQAFGLSISGVRKRLNTFRARAARFKEENS